MAIFNIQNYFCFPVSSNSTIEGTSFPAANACINRHAKQEILFAIRFRKRLRIIQHATKKIYTGLLVCLLLLAALPARAVKYFVDPSSSGSNQGTENDPWRSLADIPWSINYFQPGDTVFFKRGQQYTGTLSINSTGRNGAPIVFMPYGSGSAPFFQYNLANPVEPQPERVIIRLNQVDNIVIDGFELTDATIPENDHNVTANVAYGVFIYKGSHNIIKNLTISKLGAGISIDEGSFNTITDCTIRNLRMIVNTSHINWDDYGATGIILGGSDNTITRNHIQDCWSNSYDYQYDGGAIEVYGPVNNNRILYNTATENLGFMEFGSGKAGQAFNNLVGYNLLINNGHLCWINMGNGFGLDVRNLQLFNNNIIETHAPRLPDVRNLIGIFTTASVTNVITMKNNIFWLQTTSNITDPIVQPFNGPQLIHQNNLYHMGGGSFGYTLDLSERNLNPGDLLFMDITSSNNPATWNYNLLPAAAAINFGQSTGIDKDFFGQIVPFGGTPDAGIAEHISAVLPLQILSCRGWAGTNANIIEWETTSDSVDRFEIERSNTGNNFKRIAVVPPKINAGSTSIQYQFNDKDVTGEVQYYRIKAIEPDNTGSYSNIITIKNGVSSDDMIVSPNPARDYLYLRVPGNDFRNKEMVLINMAGMVIRREKFNEAVNQKQLNVSMLPQGAYVIKVIDNKTGGSYQTIFTK